MQPSPVGISVSVRWKKLRLKGYYEAAEELRVRVGRAWESPRDGDMPYQPIPMRPQWSSRYCPCVFPGKRRDIGARGGQPED